MIDRIRNNTLRRLALIVVVVPVVLPFLLMVSSAAAFLYPMAPSELRRRVEDFREYFLEHWKAR